jgi:hypothetical protein
LACSFLVLVPRYGLDGIAWSVVVSWGVSLIAVLVPLVGMRGTGEQVHVE